jgi:hypothetical protein
VSAVLRPDVDGHGPLTATIDGQVEVGDVPHGALQVSVAETGREVVLDVSDTNAEVEGEGDGERVLRGSATRPAGAFGLIGPPLLNPTVVLRWRATLVPAG